MQRWTPVCSVRLILVVAQLLSGCSNGPQYSIWCSKVEPHLPCRGSLSLCPWDNPLSTDPQSCPMLVTCLTEVRNSSPPWFGGEGAASLRSPICRRALGLLLLDWSSVVLNHSPGSLQARWETVSVKQGSCLCWLVRVKFHAPNAPNCACLSVQQGSCL